jgi:hypothetical protein
MFLYLYIFIYLHLLFTPAPQGVKERVKSPNSQKCTFKNFYAYYIFFIREIYVLLHMKVAIKKIYISKNINIFFSVVQPDRVPFMRLCI